MTPPARPKPLRIVIRGALAGRVGRLVVVVVKRKKKGS
jgi:hypothetical protein